MQLLLTEAAGLRAEEPLLEDTVRRFITAVAQLQTAQPHMHRHLYDQALRTPESRLPGFPSDRPTPRPDSATSVDIVAVAKRHVSSSLKKTALPRYKDGTVGEQVERGKFVLLNMDAPQHTRLCKIISRAFTPRAVERLRDDLDERAQRIVKAAAAEGSGDFVEQVSCELPLQAIAGLMGVPQEDRKKLFHWSNQIVGDMDPKFAGNDAITASVELIMYGMQMAAEKAKNPGDDLVTTLIQADVDGHKLSPRTSSGSSSSCWPSLETRPRETRSPKA